MRVLAFDTSFSVASIGVVCNRDLLAQTSSTVQEKHAEILLPRIEEVLKKADLGLSEIDLIAVGIGPGSFSGVRIGLATAKGISLAKSIPVVGVVSLRAMARTVACGTDLVATVRNAYKGEVYLAIYTLDRQERIEQVLMPIHVKPEEAAKEITRNVQGNTIRICGDGASRVVQRIDPEPCLSVHVVEPSHDWSLAEDLALEGEYAFCDNGADDLSTLQPLYVRPSDAKLPDKPLRVRR